MLPRLSLAVLFAVPAALPAGPQPDAARAAAKVNEVIGHMGSCADRPGNTLAGLRRAIEAGATASEVDVRTMPALVPRVRKAGKELHLGTGNGTRAEVPPLLLHGPESLASDDPAQLVRTLAELKR